ncbi:hypothetical protein ACQ4LE_010619 [Meloidogyne hapla]
MLNSLTSQQQQAVSQQLSIEQLLRAAKLIEQRAIIEKLPSQFEISGGFNSANFGEKYEARILAPKLRTFVDDPNCGPSSTGSSQRSSPLSASPSPDLAVLACLHSPQYYQQQQTQQHLTLLDSQQRQSISTSSAASSIASGSSMATTDARRLSTSLDDNLSPPASHGSGRRASGSRQSRAAHNELEKNRRANLRGHLEALKSVLPPESDAHRDTTLSLLTRARNYIKFVDEQKTALLKKREALLVEHHRLQQLLQQNVGEPQGQQYNDNFKESTSLISLTTQNENNFDNLQQRMKIVQIPEEREEEEENFDFTQYQVSHEFCIEENVEEENIQVETNTKPNMEYLSLNGLLPALPLLYPYSSINMAGTTTANLC